LFSSTSIGGCDFEKGSTFIKDRFVERFPKPENLFVHMTIAIDSKNVDYVFKAVRQTILQVTMKEIAVGID
jgi:hypothetical protein